MDSGHGEIGRLLVLQEAANARPAEERRQEAVLFAWDVLHVASEDPGGVDWETAAENGMGC